MRRWMALALLIPLAACRAGEEPAAPDVIDSANPLETAARDANLVVDPATTPPTGLFDRIHSSGTDSFCAVPDGDSNDYRFGLIASFGTTLTCEGQGSAVHDGETLALDFDDADCSVTARYDGQSVAMPGTVPAGCSALCGPRASMSGVSIARTGWEVADARRLRSRQSGVPLCGT
jgi:hypothetical protein